MELSAEKSSMPASLASATDITVTVTDASGRAVKRETVNLSVDQEFAMLHEVCYQITKFLNFDEKIYKE